MIEAVAILLSYLLGSIPSGLWLGLKLRGVDIREHGSKNIGATNTMRVLGKKLGAAALVFDILKGTIATAIIARLSPWEYAPLVCGIASIIGHMASIYIRFKGGKGVATSLGVFVALCPIPTLLATGVFGLVVFTTRMVSAGSIGGAVVFAATVLIMPHAWATWPTHALPAGPVLPVTAACLTAFVVYKHRSNLRRILSGTENRI